MLPDPDQTSLNVFRGPGGVPPGRKNRSPKWVTEKVTTIWHPAAGIPILIETYNVRNDINMTFPDFGEDIPNRTVRRRISENFRF